MLLRDLEKSWSFINRENWIREQLYKIGEVGLNENMSHLLTKVMARNSRQAASRIRNSKKKPSQHLQQSISYPKLHFLKNNQQILEL